MIRADQMIRGGGGYVFFSLCKLLFSLLIRNKPFFPSQAKEQATRNKSLPYNPIFLPVL